MMDENPVLAFQRNDVSDCTQGNQVEAPPQIEVRERTSFQQSVTKFEDNADTAKIAEGEIPDGLRIDDRDTLRQLRFRLMVVEHDYIRATGMDLGDFGA